jgi:protein SCO1/2
MDRKIALMAAAVLVAVLAGTAWYALAPRGNDIFAPCQTGVVAGGTGSIGGPFTLTDETGKAVTDADVIDRPTLLYFGYTFCPDVCPLDATRNAEATDLIRKAGFDIRPVFISFDPERDTPKVLAEFTDFMHPDMLGLTGTPDQIKSVANEYKVYFRKHDGEGADYLIDHSTFTYLVLPKYGTVEFFRHDETPEAVANRAQCFLSKAKG